MNICVALSLLSFLGILTTFFIFGWKQPKPPQKKSVGTPTSLQARCFEAFKKANETNTIVTFDHNGITGYTYPGETASIVEDRWKDENIADAYEHMG